MTQLQKVLEPLAKAIAPPKRPQAKKAPSPKKQKRSPAKGKSPGKKKVPPRPPKGPSVAQDFVRGIAPIPTDISGIVSRGANRDLMATNEHTEDIFVSINPDHLWQFLCGFTCASMSNRDSPVDLNTCYRMALYYFVNIDNVTSLVGVETWPRAILELGVSLRSRRIGRRTFTPDWSAKGALFDQITGSAGTLVNFSTAGTAFQYVNVPPTAGILIDNSATNTMVQAGDYEVRMWQSMNADRLDLVRITEATSLLDNGDASAFAFSTIPPSNLANFVASNATDNVLVFLSGRNTSTDVYLPAGPRTCGLETKIGKPWLANLALGTFNYGYLGTTLVSTASPVRCPMDTKIAYSPPCTMGYQAFMGLKGKVQLKQVPSQQTLAGIASRLNQAASLVPYFLSTGGMAKLDMQILTYLIWQNFMKRYAGATIGVTIATPGAQGFVQDHALHTCDSIVNSLNLPEPVLDFIGSQAAYRDSRGYIIPVTAVSDIKLIATSLTAAYTSTTPVYTQAQMDGLDGRTQNLLTNGAKIALKWKLGEAALAANCVLRPIDTANNSLLDATILRGSSTTGPIVGIASRRVLGGALISNIMANFDSVTYAVAQWDATVNSYTKTMSRLNYDHKFMQDNRVDLGGYDAPADITAIAAVGKYVVAGANASNIAGNDAPGSNSTNGINVFPAPVAPPQTARDVMTKPLGRPRAGSILGLQGAPRTPVLSGSAMLDKFKKMFQYGNFCGLDYSGGGPSSQAEMVDGEYVVKPIDDLDAVCKTHDEDYHRVGDVRKFRHVADTKFSSTIKSEPEKYGQLGRAMAAYFDTFKPNYDPEDWPEHGSALKQQQKEEL